MEIFLFVLAALLIIFSIIGSIVPGIPGPPLGYAGLWILQLTDKVNFSTSFLVVWGVIVVVITILDYYLPIWSTKKIGGTKYGVNGSIIGMIVGIVFTPIGVIFGTLLGAIIGELIGGAKLDASIKSGLATFVGVMLGTGIKVLICSIFAFYFLKELFL